MTDIRIIGRLPGVGEHGDVSDLIEAGWTAERLRELFASSPCYEPNSAAESETAANAEASNSRNARAPRFERVGELLANSQDDASVEWVVDGLIPLGGTAILAGRPKEGKSTLALNLALAMVRGETFMRRRTRKGPVLYLALEGARNGWRAELRRMGAANDDDLSICIDRAPDAAIAWLAREVERCKPVLVIIDTVQRLLRVKDGQDYASGSNAMDALIELARKYQVALLLLHHSPKRSYGQIADDVLGSTAWAASVDTILRLRTAGVLAAPEDGGRAHCVRTLASEQRYGEPLPESVVEMDAVTHRVRPGGTKAEHDRATMSKSIIALLKEYESQNPEEPLATEGAILKGIRGRKVLIQEVLRDAVRVGAIERTGSGKRGDPYRYADSAFLPPDSTREVERVETEIDEDTHKVETFSTSRESESRENGRQNPGENDEWDGMVRSDDDAQRLFAYADKTCPSSGDEPPVQGELDL